jgi:hypothetical protein
MTNTLHRSGAPASLKNDYVVFAMAARGINDEGAPGKLQAFLRLALRHQPVNLGNAVRGGIYRGSENLTPLVHWRRDDGVDPEDVVRSVDTSTTVAAVFDDISKVERFIRDLKTADLGVSINISGLTDEAHACCQRAGITRHSVEYSLGFRGDLGRLPEERVLELSTMCGHGMVSHSLARKMMDLVREGRRSPEQGAACLARFCTCGVYNPTRAAQILEMARQGK